MRERAVPLPPGTRLGYLAPSDKKPSTANIKRYWTQCQHGSWYFLPWHRGYLLDPGFVDGLLFSDGNVGAKIAIRQRFFQIGKGGSTDLRLRYLQCREVG